MPEGVGLFLCRYLALSASARPQSGRERNGYQKNEAGAHQVAVRRARRIICLLENCPDFGLKPEMDWRSSLFVGLVGMVVGGVLTHNLATRRDRQTARRNAAATFQADVLAVLKGLYPLPFEWPADPTETLRKAAPELQSAVAQFRPFIPWRRRRAFDRAWFTYRSGTGREIDVQNYHHYIAFGSNPNARENSRRNVDALLSFANVLRILLLAAPIVFFGGCNVQQQRMESSLNAYMGRSVAEFVADHGDPTSMVKLTDKESAFRWVITGRGVGAVIPMGTSLIVAPPTQRVCTVSLRATTQSPSPELKDWIIQSWNWQGAC
jgi:hypothetical protein